MLSLRNPENHPRQHWPPKTLVQVPRSFEFKAIVSVNFSVFFNIDSVDLLYLILCLANLFSWCDV